MIIYGCDMCGKTFPDKEYVHEITARVNEEGTFGDGWRTFDVCDECSRLVGDFIHGYKARTRGLNCSIDTRFGGKS